MFGNRTHKPSEVRANVFALVFFFNDTATTEIYTLSYTLSLHDALPISARYPGQPQHQHFIRFGIAQRSEEHTSELQSHSEISYAVFCLKKKNTDRIAIMVVFLGLLGLVLGMVSPCFTAFASLALGPNELFFFK